MLYDAYHWVVSQLLILFCYFRYFQRCRELFTAAPLHFALHLRYEVWLATPPPPGPQLYFIFNEWRLCISVYSLKRPRGWLFFSRFLFASLANRSLAHSKKMLKRMEWNPQRILLSTPLINITRLLIYIIMITISAYKYILMQCVIFFVSLFILGALGIINSRAKML